VSSTTPDNHPDGTVFIHPNAIVDTYSVGPGTRVWAFAHVMDGASIGAECNIGEGCFVESGATVGDHVTIKNGVAVWNAVSIGDFAFIGPNVVFANDLYPRSWIKPPRWTPTVVDVGASIGSNATLVCGVTVGRFSMVGAGAVVTRGVKPYELVVGNPARHAGWVCGCGLPLEQMATSCSCGAQITWEGTEIATVVGAEPS